MEGGKEEEEGMLLNEEGTKSKRKGEETRFEEEDDKKNKKIKVPINFYQIQCITSNSHRSGLHGEPLSGWGGPRHGAHCCHSCGNKGGLNYIIGRI